MSELTDNDIERVINRASSAQSDVRALVAELREQRRKAERARQQLDSELAEERRLRTEAEERAEKLEERGLETEKEYHAERQAREKTEVQRDHWRKYYNEALNLKKEADDDKETLRNALENEKEAHEETEKARKETQRATELEAKRADAMSKRAEQAEADSIRHRRALENILNAIHKNVTIPLDGTEMSDAYYEGKEVLKNESFEPQGEDEHDAIMRTLREMPQHRQYQGSLHDQLMMLHQLANRCGLYDAADWVSGMMRKTQSEPDTAEGRNNEFRKAIRTLIEDWPLEGDGE